MFWHSLSVVAKDSQSVEFNGHLSVMNNTFLKHSAKIKLDLTRPYLSLLEAVIISVNLI